MYRIELTEYGEVHAQKELGIHAFFTGGGYESLDSALIELTSYGKQLIELGKHYKVVTYQDGCWLTVWNGENYSL